MGECFFWNVSAGPGSPGQNPEGRKTVVVVLLYLTTSTIHLLNL